MLYKDTLTLYEELTASGVPEDQAKIQAHQIGSLGDCLSNSIHSLETKLETRFLSIDTRFASIEKIISKLDKDMFWMRVIGAAMTATFFAHLFKGSL